MIDLLKVACVLITGMIFGYLWFQYAIPWVANKRR